MVASHVLEYDKILKEKSKQARAAIQKNDINELDDLHKKNRIKMGGLEESLTEEDIEKISAENKIKAKELKEKSKEDSTPTQSVTLKLILEDKSLEEICKIRDLKSSTILEHICDIAGLPEFKNITEVQDKINKIITSELEIFYEKNKKNADFKTKTSRSKIIKQIQAELKENEKMKPVFEKYSKLYSGLDYSILKLIRIIA